jgi:hypothetical protein
VITDTFKDQGKDPGQSIPHPRFWSTLGREEGQIIPLIALLLPILIMMLGLTVDIGLAQAEQRRMQTAADMAALGGARSMSMLSDVAVAEATSQGLLGSNGADVSLSQITISPADGAIIVVARQQMPTNFLALVNIPTIDVAASATAVWGSAGSATDLLPFAVEEGVWALGSVVNLATLNGGSGSGNFAWVHWPGQGPSTPTLLDNIGNPQNSGTITVGSRVSGSPGNAFPNPQVEGALQAYLGQTVTFFLYDAAEVTGNGNNLSYRVTGFASFTIVDVDRRNDRLIGRFEGQTTLGGSLVPGQGQGSFTSIGLFR